MKEYDSIWSVVMGKSQRLYWFVYINETLICIHKCWYFYKYGEYDKSDDWAQKLNATKFCTKSIFFLIDSWVWIRNPYLIYKFFLRTIMLRIGNISKVMRSMNTKWTKKYKRNVWLKGCHELKLSDHFCCIDSNVFNKISLILQ